jgi:hypothetical protein
MANPKNKAEAAMMVLSYAFMIEAFSGPRMPRSGTTRNWPYCKKLSQRQRRKRERWAA